MFIAKSNLSHPLCPCSLRSGAASARWSAVRESAAAGGTRRGILMVAGGRDQLLNALVTLRVLRLHHKCSLPVEVVHFGQEELDPEAAQALRDFAAATSDIGVTSLIDGFGDPSIQKGVLRYHRDIWPKGYSCKVYALAFVTTLHEVGARCRSWNRRRGAGSGGCRTCCYGVYGA